MSPRAQGFAVALALAGSALAAIVLLAPPAPPPSLPAPVAAEDGPPEAAAPAAPATAAPPATTPVEPERLPPPAREAAPAPTMPQGLRGRAVDGDGRPLGGLTAYLVDSASNDPLAISLLQRHEDAFRPLASGETAADGTFALGLAVAQDRTYEVYVASPRHATARLGGLSILAGQWHDLGDVTMVLGATLRGRVTVAGRPDIPVGGAVVTVAIGTSFADAPLRALPDAGHGLVATTGPDGAYELRHVPSRGVVQASAVAAGFARQHKTNLELRADAPCEVDFALLPGKSITGRVVDGNGAALAQARIEAWPLEASGEALAATSAADGSFEVAGLGLGKHALKATLRGYATVAQAGLEGGARDVQLQLTRLGAARVRVVAPDGSPLRRFRLGLRRVFVAQGGQIAAVADVADRNVALTADVDAIDLEGIPSGEFCLQVEADGFAKTLSAPFRCEPTEAAAPIDMVVTMGPGATLRGRVVGADGAPLAGAAVRTAAAGIAADSPFHRMLASAVPDRITAAEARTDADGMFTLERLAFASYQLLVDHEDACRGGVDGLVLDTAGVRTLPPIVLTTGAYVAGRATIAGQPVAQMKVVLSTPPDRRDAAAVRLEAVTDPQGNYRLSRRVPPGTYELRAARTGGDAPEAHVLHMVLQLQRSVVPVAVPHGQGEVRADIDLPNDR